MRTAEARAPRRRSALTAGLERLRREHGFATLAEVVCFLYVAENEGLSVKQLAALAGTSLATASRTARAFAPAAMAGALPPARGLVEMRLHGADARERRLFLTPAGLALREALDAAIARGDLIGGGA